MTSAVPLAPKELRRLRARVGDTRPGQLGWNITAPPPRHPGKFPKHSQGQRPRAGARGYAKTLLLFAQSGQNLEDLLLRSGSGDLRLCRAWDTVPPLPRHGTKAWGLQCKPFEPAVPVADGTCAATGDPQGTMLGTFLFAHSKPTTALGSGVF